MDKRVAEHADALFIFKLKELEERQNEELRALEADLNRRNLSRSGISLSNLLKTHAIAIGLRMEARLESFREAFEAASAQPSPEDFRIIWQGAQSVYAQGIATAQQQAGRRSVAMGLPPDRVPNIQASAAHGHDKALAKYNIWRTQVGLSEVNRELVVASIPQLAELRDKAACATDLQGLLNAHLESHHAVLYIDLDNFKDVNTAKGHDGGDQCIEKAARIISVVVQYKGRVYRLHRTGDEFAVLLPNCDDLEARATAERIRRAVEQGKPGGEILVTTSIGVFVARGNIAADEALKQADQAMYEAKKTKNAVHFSEATNLLKPDIEEKLQP
jgi:diguanylate cyclase (GGDEF)-like protein